jgi:rubrerythrin
MKIKEITYQYRRDFKAIYICQGCGNEYKGGGYDDANFHNNVIPTMRCPICGETTESLGVDYRPLTTKYPEGFQI